MRKPFMSLLLIFILLGGGAVIAQTDDSTPTRVEHVGIISGRLLRSAAVSNIGDDGISRLQDMLIELGATVETIAPEQEIPEEIELIILIRPQRALSALQTSIFWQFLKDGGHLLLALDPYDHANARTERARNGGFNVLLDQEYGLNIVDDILLESWFSVKPLSDIVTSWSDAKAEELQPHPITQPLVQYNLPIRVWGARQIIVSSPVATAETNALLYTESSHGETTRLNYELNDPTQTELNIGEDSQGRLILAGIATHQSTGSRVALLGDSEIFQNIFGQTEQLTDSATPLYIGDSLFAQRLLAWLMAIPEDEWPPLPDTVTWIALDGNTNDWEELVPLQAVTDAATSIERLGVFHNDQFMYLALHATTDWNEFEAMELMGESRDGAFHIRLENSVVTDDEGVIIQDANYVIADALEIQLPLRITGTNPTLTDICLETTDTDSRCINISMVSVAINKVDPVPVRFSNGPTAFLLNGANLRAAPSDTASIVTILTARTQFSLRGRDESGMWVYVMNGRHQGWLAAFLVAANVDVLNLPVVNP